MATIDWVSIVTKLKHAAQCANAASADIERVQQLARSAAYFGLDAGSAADAAAEAGEAGTIDLTWPCAVGAVATAAEELERAAVQLRLLHVQAHEERARKALL